MTSLIYLLFSSLSWILSYTSSSLFSRGFSLISPLLFSLMASLLYLLFSFLLFSLTFFSSLQHQVYDTKNTSPECAELGEMGMCASLLYLTLSYFLLFFSITFSHFLSLSPLLSILYFPLFSYPLFSFLSSLSLLSPLFSLFVSIISSLPCRYVFLSNRRGQVCEDLCLERMVGMRLL